MSALDSKFANGAFNRHPRVIPVVLSEAGEGIEKGSFARIWITDNSDDVTTLCSAVRNGRVCRKGSRSSRCGNGHQGLTLPSQEIEHNTPGFVATQGDVETTNANLHRVAQWSKSHHAHELSEGEPHLGKALREPVAAQNCTDTTGFVWAQVCKSSVHRDQMIMIFNFTVNSCGHTVFIIGKCWYSDPVSATAIELGWGVCPER